MANPIEWTFKMTDQITGPARSGARGIGELVRSMDSALNLLDRVAGAAMGAGRMMARALEPAMFKESTIAGLSVLLRDSQKAEQMYREAVKFAAATPFETRQVVDSYQKLLVAGFQETEIPIVLKGVGDLAAIKGFSQETIDRVTLAFGQIKAKGKLQGEEIMQLAEAGVPLGKVYETLAQIYGKNTDAIRKMQEAGKIGADAGIFAVLKVLRDDIGGGKLGSVMDKTSKSLGGLVSTLRSRPFEYLQELEDTGGFDSLKSSIDALNRALDPASEKGQKLLGIVKDFGGGLLERIFGEMNEGAVSGLMDRLIFGMEALETATFGFVDGLSMALEPFDDLREGETTLEDIGATFKTLGADLGVIVRVAGGVAGAIDSIFSKLRAMSSWFADQELLQSLFTGNPLFNVGAFAATGSVRQGFMQSSASIIFDKLGLNQAYAVQEGDVQAQAAALRERYSAAGGAYSPAYSMAEENGTYVGEGLAQGLDKGMRSSLGVNSPAKVTEGIGQEIGGYAGEGLAQGMRGGLSSTGAGLVFSPTIQVSANTVQDAEGIARVVEDVLVAQVEAWALQLGVA